MQKDSWLFSLANTICYGICWFLWIYFGSKGFVFFPALCSVAFFVAQLFFLYKKQYALWIQDVLLVLEMATLGLVFEILFIQAHWIFYQNHNSLLPPIWIYALYPLFALTVNHALKISFTRPFLSFVIGVVGAFFTYSFGAKLKVASFPSWGWRISLGWGILFLILYWMRKKGQKIVTKALDPKELSSSITVLFDGACPVCSREIALLKKKNPYQSILFVDIASKEYEPKKYQGISTKEAMKKIHAIDSKGKILKGLDVFFALYSRSNLPLLASLIKAPLFSPIFSVFYSIFCRIRTIRLS